MVLATSCEQILDVMGNSLTFLFSGTTIYDGQTALLGVTYNNDVAWTVPTEYQSNISLTYNEHGKNCVAKVNLPAGATEAKVVKVTNYDPKNSSVEKNTGEITIAPWRLEVLKKKTDGEYEDLLETNTAACTYTASTGQTLVDLKKAGTGTYKIKMYGLNDKGKFASIAPIYSLNLFSHPEHRVCWEVSGTKVAGLATDASTVAEGVYEKEVVIDALPAANETVTVYLGKDRDDNNNVLSPKNDTKSAKKTVLFKVK